MRLLLALVAVIATPALAGPLALPKLPTLPGLPGAPGAAPALDIGAAERVKAAYLAFDPAVSCPENHGCGGALRRAAKVEEAAQMFNPRGKMENPDPAWLTGWDSLPSGAGLNDATKVFEVMGDTARIKASRAACTAAYAAGAGAEAGRADAAMQAHLTAALALPLHDRLAALVALRKAPEGAGAVGGRYHLERTILDQLAAAPLLAAAFDAQIVVDPAFAKTLRPRLPGAIEADLACVDEVSSAGNSLVRRPYTADERTALDAAIAAASDLRAPERPAPDPKARTLVAVVDDVSGAPGAWSVRATRSKSDQVVLACKESKDRTIVENGKIVPDKSCTYGVKITTYAATLGFADLPAAGMKAGDEVVIRFLAGDEVVSSQGAGTAKASETTNVTGEGVLVLRFSRGGTTVWDVQGR